jgi:uncharacterized BrkB/YihY/UPF0761 family membrane protein
MGAFFTGLKNILGPQMLWEVVLGMRRNDLLGLAGQLAYFFLLFFFPFLTFLLYYLAPDANLPFRWITPGGFVATVLLFASDGASSYYVANLGCLCRELRL